MKSKIYTDQEIIDAILSNDKKVLSFLYEYNFDSLNKKIIIEGGSRKDTEDIFQDSLLILFLKIQKNELKLTSSVHTFLHAIARNLWKRKVVEKAARFGNIEDINEVPEDVFDEDYVQIERRKLYQKHLENLPTDCRRLIKMILDGLSLQEITRLIPYNSLEFTKTKRFRCKVMLIKKIINDPLYKELKDERFRTTGSIPRW
jgi:DNA-directed RNA polymerase specialized sigma24 family protein